MAHAKLTKRRVRETRSTYEKNKFSNRHTCARQFYKYMDNRISAKSDVSTLKVEGIELTTDSDKANALSDHYKKIFTEDNGQVPNFPRRHDAQPLEQVVITEELLIKSIRKMNSASAPGGDSINPCFIKKCFSFLN